MLAVRRYPVASIFHRLAAARADFAAVLQLNGSAATQAFGRLAPSFDESEKRAFIRIGVEIVEAEIVFIIIRDRKRSCRERVCLAV